MRRWITFILGLIFMTSVQAQTKADADSAYIREDYEKAAQIYTTLLKQGKNAVVYYNLANCYYKTDRIALAVLNYERSLLFDPGNANVRFNLDMARSKTIDKITPKSEMFFVTWYHSLIDSMSVDGWARTGIIAFLCLILFVLLYLFNFRIWVKKVGFFGAVASLLLVILANVFAFQQKKELTDCSGAVIMSSSVVIKSTPNSSGTDLFVLHEGTKVEIIDHSMKDWKEIKLADGKTGWLPIDVIEII